MTAATAGAAKRDSLSGRRLALRVEPYLYVSPAVLAIVLVLVMPLAVGISYAFRDIVLLNPMSGDYIGFDHFRDLVVDANFWRSLENTVKWTVTSVILQFFLGLILALLLNRPFPGRGVAQALVFLPWAVPTFLAGLDWAWLLNPVVGPLPHWAVALGLASEPMNILSDPNLALWGPIAANVWWGFPFFAITLLAALQSIPADIYEAAEIDGASAAQRFFTITAPLLAPTVVITVLLRTIWIANAPDLIVVMTHGGPADATQIVASYIFTQAFQRLDFGYASAIATVLLVMLLAYAFALVALRQLLIRRN
jgi:multiple sugar transport system permease protein